MAAPQMVLGFMFNRYLTEVVLMVKERPAWQAGLLNGIGGHIEPDETPRMAMAREFLEETGCQTRIYDWQPCFKMIRSCGDDGDFAVRVFRCIADVPSLKPFVRTAEDQEVLILKPFGPWNLPCVSNLPWIVAMLTDLNPGDCPSYHVQGIVGPHEHTRPLLAAPHA